MLRKIISTVLLSLAGITQAQSEPMVSIDDARPSVNILESGKFQYFSSTEHVTIGDVFKSPWVTATSDRFPPISRATDYWFRFNLRSEMTDAKKFVLYMASNFIIERMDVYRVTSSGPELISTGGTQIPLSQRTMKHRIPSARIDLDRGEVGDFLIHVHTDRPFKPDFTITTAEGFVQYLETSNVIYGFCIGIQAIVILIASIFAYRLRDKAYASFSVMSMAMILMILVSYGFRDASQFLSNSSVSSSAMVKVLRPAVTFFFLYQTAVFLSLRTRSPRLYQWFQATMLSIVTLVALSFTDGIATHAIGGADRLIFIGMILSGVASFRAWRQGVPMAGYFLVATFALISSIIPWLVAHTAGRAIPPLALDLVPIGQSIEMSILVMAMIAKVRKIDEARAMTEIEAGKNEELKTLVRVLSHDLNNPLSVIMAYAQKGLSSAEKSGDTEIARYFAKILKSSENQLDIIEHIKIMRAIQDGKSDLQLTSVPLLEVMRQAEATFEQRLMEKQLKLNYNHSSMKDVHVIAEVTSLNHNILNNLISNAIKFSHPGSSIDITVSVYESMVSFTIEDHGVGIPKDLIANIFRTDKSTSRPGTQGEKGTGFGMPVVKSYVQRFGGDIKIDSATESESPERHGTRVTVSLKKAA